MGSKILSGDMVFLAEGREGIGAVREVSEVGIVIYVENAGEFEIAMSAVRSAHDRKVVLDPAKVGAKVLAAVRHAHDGEDPALAG